MAGKIIKKKTFLHDEEKKENDRSEVLLIETPEYQELIERVYGYLKQGMRSNEILATLMVEDSTMSETKFTRVLRYAYAFAENALHKDREYMFQLHMDRYEDIYRESMDMTNRWTKIPLDPKNDWNIITGKYISAMKALKSKESLLGLHDKSTVIEFDDSKAVVIEKEEMRGNAISGYNLDRLDLQEKIDLLKLIQESRTVPIQGVHRVVVKKTKIKIDINSNERSVIQDESKIDKVDTIDVEYEDMPANVVDKFNTTNSKKDTKKDDIPESPIVIEDVPSDKGKTFDEVKRNLESGLMGSLKNKLKKRDKS